MVNSNYIFCSPNTPIYPLGDSDFLNHIGESTFSIVQKNRAKLSILDFTKVTSCVK